MPLQRHTSLCSFISFLCKLGKELDFGFSMDTYLNYYVLRTLNTLNSQHTDL